MEVKIAANEKNIGSIHTLAVAAASQATEKHLRENSDWYPCGFSWVVVRGVRSNSRIGTALQVLGFHKPYGSPGQLHLWNPSGSMTQSMDAKIAGSEAYARVLRDSGIDAYADSRID